MLISGERRKRRGTSCSGENNECKGGGLGTGRAAGAPRGGGAEAGRREEELPEVEALRQQGVRRRSAGVAWVDDPRYRSRHVSLQEPLDHT